MVEHTGSLPSFEEFYRAVHDREPLPWQTRLAQQVHDQSWPEAIGVPTGLGKTAAIDVAVWATACDADRAPEARRAATRIWYVVNRRLLVDAAFDHGRTLAGLLCDAERASASGPLQAVACRLRHRAAMSGEHGPLHVGLVRGGAPRTAQVPDPSMPALLFATVPMFASRWLFEGYGASRSNRPIEAALAGTDSLVLLDESHLSRPLRDLVEPLIACDAGRGPAILPSGRNRPQIVQLTATGEGTDFELDAADLAHDVVKQRLNATKPTALVESSKHKIARELATQASALVAQNPATATVVFSNSPARAREVHRLLLEQLSEGADVVLLTGRIRDVEAETVRRRLLDPDQGAPASPIPVQRSHPLVVSATQTLEVGADLDFDHLVTESAGARAIVQRFGRLNRLGVRNSQAAAVLCHAPDDQPSPLYGSQPAEVWNALQQASDTDRVALESATITEAVGQPDDEPPRTGAVLPDHLWEWVKTSCPPPDRAPIEPFVDGIESALAEVTVAWRAIIPRPPEPRDQANDHSSVEPRLTPRLHASETIELPLGEVRDALAARPEVSVFRIVDDGLIERVARGERGPALRPGDQVVLPWDAGLADVYGWNRESSGPVPDVSPLVTGTVLLARPLLHSLAHEIPEDLGEAMDALNAEDPGTGEPLDRSSQTVARLIRGLGELELANDGLQEAWEAVVAELARAPENEVLIDEPGMPLHLRTPRARHQPLAVATDVLDELSFDASSTDLSEHCGTVGDLARRIGEHLGLPEELVAIAHEAGRLHDLGKADPRFQRWLDPHGAQLGRRLAKSSYSLLRSEAYRVAADWPRGGRHEVISARLAQALVLDYGPLTTDDDLLVHLAISHHGFGRPSVPVPFDPVGSGARHVEAEHDGVTIAAGADLTEVDWDQPARFRRMCERYGYWGLALLEAIVRKADHAASGRTQRGGR